MTSKTLAGPASARNRNKQSKWRPTAIFLESASNRYHFYLKGAAHHGIIF
jgi:hypothetical protein